MMRHKRFWSLMMGAIVFGLAGCSQPVPTIPFLDQGGTPLSTARPIVVTPLLKPKVTITPKSTATVEAAVGTTAPPALAGDWKMFVSPNLQIAVDYPSDWSAVEQGAVVTFKSPQGGVIQLALLDTGNLLPEDFARENQLPNTRCETRVTANGLTAQVCFDTLSGSYSASIPIELSDGTKQLLSLALFKGGDRQVFEAMIESVRPAP
ncbi:MAG: hypothetical protein HYZ49_02270 [Chloroflexi bacterium]|nr:hypothetical protein [Chloroflexota bacterium]